MKILFVTPRFPYPPHRGDTSVPYHRLRLLGKRHEITLLSFYEEEGELAGVEGLLPYCRSVEMVRLPRWRSYLGMILAGGLSRLPLQIIYYRCGAFRRRLDELLARESFDLVHVSMLRVAPYFERLEVPKVIDLIDSMQLNFQRRVSMERFPKRLLLQEELRRVSAYERGIGEHFEELIVVSEKDRALIPCDRVSVIPLGVETGLFAPAPDLPRDPVIIFSGNMFYSPNIQAVHWFVEKCFPRIREAVPAASLLIVGNRPPKGIVELGEREGITVTGFVPSMPEALVGSRVSVTPMQSGSGMQCKILEAMSCGIPVVTTTLGLGDIRAAAGEEIFVADAPETFAAQVVRLLTDLPLAREVGARARLFVMEHHSWESAADAVERVYRRALHREEPVPLSRYCATGESQERGEGACYG